LNISNWRVISESQDEKLHPEFDLDLSLSQLPICTHLSSSTAPLHERPQEEAGLSRPSKQPRVEHRWHGNLQQDARALVILLQIGCDKLGTRYVTFGGIFKALNNDQYSCCLRPIKGSRCHQRWFEGLVISLSKADRADYIAIILRRILKFLQLE
jgi:hypothetical protein